ncbi:MAG: hypothetical protein WAW96_01710 [Alphaproteobacteria bacterium]
MRDETRPEVLTERAKSFEADLHKLGFSGTVKSCSHMVVLAVGVKGGDFVYGAVCNVAASGKTKQLLLCNDEMVGNFTLTSTFSATRDAIAEFTRRNCYGG